MPANTLVSSADLRAEFVRNGQMPLAHMIAEAERDGWNQALQACILLLEKREADYIGPWTRETMRMIHALRAEASP